MWNLDEALIALRAAILAETDVTDLLASSSAFYRERPRVKVDYPALIMLLEDDRPQTQFDGAGAWRPTIEIGIIAEKLSVCRAIMGQLDRHFTIPEERAAPVNSDNLSITRFRRTAGIEMGPVMILNTDQEVYLINTIWASKVQPLT